MEKLQAWEEESWVMVMEISIASGLGQLDLPPVSSKSKRWRDLGIAQGPAELTSPGSL